MLRETRVKLLTYRAIRYYLSVVLSCEFVIICYSSQSKLIHGDNNSTYLLGQLQRMGVNYYMTCAQSSVWLNVMLTETKAVTTVIDLNVLLLNDAQL